jgi:type I phosphodiesterase/nucleotide pyrophosphatase
MFRSVALVLLLAASTVGTAQVRSPTTAEILNMFARNYVPGRSGQIFIAPRQGEVITRDEPTALYMHGSPWPYDTDIPIFFVGPQVTPGVRTGPARQQDVAVTLAAALGVAMPATATGRVLPVLRANAPKPRVVFILVLDGMRIDYFTRYASQMPTLSALRQRAAWFSNARIDYLPTATGAGHSSVATGTEPRFHGITGNNLYDRAKRARFDMYAGWNPRDLMALTLADVWQLATGGRAVVIAQGSSAPAATALGGHGACQVGGSRILHAGYDQTKGVWRTNEECFTLLPAVAALDVKSIFPPGGLWMGHKVDSSLEIRYTALFPQFEADAFTRMVESQPIGADNVTDLLLLNFKAADYVGHKHGPDSKELPVALNALDTQLARVLAAVEAKVGKDYLLAVTADHGMPPEPPKGRERRFAVNIVELVNGALDPQRKGVVTYYEPENAQMFVDPDRLAELKLTLDDVAAFLRKQPFVYAAFTEHEVSRASALLK